MSGKVTPRFCNVHGCGKYERVHFVTAMDVGARQVGGDPRGPDGPPALDVGGSLCQTWTGGLRQSRDPEEPLRAVSNPFPNSGEDFCEIVALEERWRRLEICASPETRQGFPERRHDYDRPLRVQIIPGISLRGWFSDFPAVCGRPRGEDLHVLCEVSWCVLLGFYASGYDSYVCLSMPLLYCRFHRDRSLLSALGRLVPRAVAAAVSASPSPTSLRRRFCPLLRHRQLWSTCLFLEFFVVHLQTWRTGSLPPKKRPDSPRTACCFRVRSNIAYVMQVDARPVMSTPPGHFCLQSGGALQNLWFSRLRAFLWST